MIFKPSIEQNKIKQLVKEGKIIKIISLAGTGKTTTLVFIAEDNLDKRIIYLVFGKANEIEARTRFPRKNTHIKTTHALARDYLKYNTKLKLNKIRKNYKAREISNIYNCPIEIAENSLKIFETFCNSSAHSFFELLGDEEAIEIPKLMFGDMISGKLDITHSFYLKYYHLILVNVGPNKLRYDIAMIDEAQDTNLVTLDIFLRLDIPQKIFVGDENQQIFAFRGSKDIMRMVDGEIAYLTETFRFNQEIADIANMVLKKFKGEKILVKTKIKTNKNNLKDTCFLSRTNSSLIKKIDNLISNNIRFRTVRNPKDIFSLIIDVYYLKSNKKNKISHNFYLKGFKNIKELEEYAINIDDIELLSAIKTIEEYGEKTNTKYEAKIFELQDIAQSYYDKNDNKTNIFLTTAHASKGLEWDRVIIEDDFPNFAKKISESQYSSISRFRKGIHNVDALIVNEINLFYVAITRAKQDLIIHSINKDYLEMNDSDLNIIIKDFKMKKNKKDNLTTINY